MKQSSINNLNTNSITLPPKILAELKKHDAHIDNKLCMECGYQGKMGVKKSGLQPIGAGFLALVFTGAMAATGYLGIIGLSALCGFFWVFIMQLSANPTLSCPNCHAELDQQGKLKNKPKAKTSK